MANYFCYLILVGIQQPLFYKRDELGKLHLKRKEYLALSCIELIFLAGFRGYTVGADTVIYLQAIDFYGKLPFGELVKAKLVPPFDFELGYFALTKMCVALSIGKTGFLFVVACITYIPIFYTITKYSEIPYISILCYFAFGLFSYSLGIFRQMIAVSIVLCGWNYVVKQQFIKYLLTIALAMSFHTTAIVAIALYFLYGIKWERIIILLPCIEMCLLIFGRPIVLLAVKLLPKYTGFLGGQYDLSGGSYLMLILLNVVLIASIFTRKKGLLRDNIVICALILAVCVQIVGYSMAIFGRMVSYFSIYMIFAIPNIIKRVDSVSRPIFVVAVVAVLFLFAFKDFNGNQYVTPYYTIFNELNNQYHCILGY